MKAIDSHKKIIFIAILALGFALFSSFVFNFINNKKKDYHEINYLYLTSLTSSKLHLSSIITGILDDTNIRNNIKMNFKNSLNRALLNKIRLGELDQINIYQENCQLLTFSSLNEKGQFVCHKPFVEGYSWQSKNRNHCRWSVTYNYS